MILIEKNIRLSDLKNISANIYTKYNIDISGISYNSLKYRVLRILSLYNFDSVDEMIKKIISERTFFEVFLSEISIPTTEMFRDPPMWQALKDSILPKFKKYESINIWLPEISSDDELYTLLIVLKEANMLENSKIIATSFSEKKIKEASSRAITLKNLNANVANYQRYNEKQELSQYLQINKKNAVLDVNLLNNVRFLKNSFFSKNTSDFFFDLVIFRNRMLFYNSDFQNKVLDTINDSIIKGGYLIIGIKESLKNWNLAYKYKLVVKHENIYKKHR